MCVGVGADWALSVEAVQVQEGAGVRGRGLRAQQAQVPDPGVLAGQGVL